ncbi:MAG: hypothetical protein R3B84_13300 [Zavarzinella sp.]
MRGLLVYFGLLVSGVYHLQATDLPESGQIIMSSEQALVPVASQIPTENVDEPRGWYHLPLLDDLFPVKHGKHNISRSLSAETAYSSVSTGKRELDASLREPMAIFSGADNPTRSNVVRGYFSDPDRIRYRTTQQWEVARITTRMELPGQDVFEHSYAARDWRADERLQVPLPWQTPLIDQLYLYGQLVGNGDTLNNQGTALQGKTMLGMRWAPLQKTSLHVRTGTRFDYQDIYSEQPANSPRPAVELLAIYSLTSKIDLEYFTSAMPGLDERSPGRIFQEWRVAMPIGNHFDNELEFGARYSWDAATVAPAWHHRMQLFVGIRLRH